MGRVVLCTGGFACNKEMLELYIGPDADEGWYRGNPASTGDGHIMAKEAGAGLVRMAGSNAINFSMVSPENVHAGNPSYVLHYGLCINRDGLRYVDEGLMYSTVCPALLNQPGQVASIVFDEECRLQKAPMNNIINQYEVNNIPYVKANT